MSIIQRTYHPILIAIMKKQRQYTLHNINELPKVEGNYLIVANHSCRYDFPIVSEVVGRHAYVLVGKQRLEVLDRLCFF